MSVSVLRAKAPGTPSAHHLALGARPQSRSNGELQRHTFRLLLRHDSYLRADNFPTSTWLPLHPSRHTPLGQLHRIIPEHRLHMTVEELHELSCTPEMMH